MSTLVYFERKLDSLVLEQVKQQATSSWLSSQTMPTEIVDALKPYSAPADSTARHALNYIRQHLAELKPKKEMR